MDAKALKATFLACDAVSTKLRPKKQYRSFFISSSQVQLFDEKFTFPRPMSD
jgi:hypothetical protein